MIQRILWREDEEPRKGEPLGRKDETRRKRRKQRKEKAERQRKLVEERRREEEDALRLQVEREEEEWRRQMEEEDQTRRKEEERSRQVEVDREAKKNEMKLDEDRRRQEDILRKNGMALEGEEEKEREEGEEAMWLRGYVFQMTANEPEEPNLLRAPILRPASREDELEEPQDIKGGEEKEVLIHNRAGLPPGCDISDVTVACENAKLNYFPPLAIPELKCLSLEGK